MDLKLVMFKPNGQRKDFPVTKPLTVIGRGENCDLQVPLENVSRRHCEINLAGEQVRCKDLASSNGTYVNNKRINEAALKAGDRLVVGPIVFTVQINGAPEEIIPARVRSPKSAEARADEIVELEADIAQTQAEEIDIFAAAAEQEAEEIDPIAALEALAAEGQKEEDEKRRPS
jgi:pSer/pThr/pTyr-binding forkhead associated (FHA) protein